MRRRIAVASSICFRPGANGVAGGDDERVVWDALVIQQHFVRLGIDACHLAEQHAHIALPAEQAADGRGDIGRR